MQRRTPQQPGWMIELTAAVDIPAEKSSGFGQAGCQRQSYPFLPAQVDAAKPRWQSRWPPRSAEVVTGQTAANVRHQATS